MVPSSITRWGWWGSGGGRKGLTAAPSPEVLGGHAQPPPNPRLFQAPAALTAGVEDDLHVPVVAVALSQGDTGGGGRGGPGVGIGTQRVGRALQAWGGDTQRWGQPRSALDHGHGPKDAPASADGISTAGGQEHPVCPAPPAASIHHASAEDRTEAADSEPGGSGPEPWPCQVWGDLGTGGCSSRSFHTPSPTCQQAGALHQQLEGELVRKGVAGLSPEDVRALRGGRGGRLAPCTRPPETAGGAARGAG